MHNHKMQNQRGFTLIELIVVLAILAIVAAIAVPTAFSSIEKARTAACVASMNNLSSKMRQDAVLATMGDGLLAAADAPDIISSVVADCKGTVGTDGKVTGFCPSGGTYTITYDANTGLFAITCDKHSVKTIGGYLDPTVDGKPLVAGIISTVAAAASRVDSTAKTNADYIGLVNSALQKDTGHTTAEYGMTSWSYIKGSGGNYELLWTTQDISDMTPGSPVNVLRYNSSTGTYTVWQGTVTAKTQDGNTYNTLAASKVLYGSSTTGDALTYENALAYYENFA